MRLITIEDVDAQLASAGATWPPGAASQSDKARAVLELNAWLSREVRRTPEGDPPAAFLDAAVLLLPAAGAGTLFTDTEREVLSKSVSAGNGVTVARTFTAGSVERSAAENTALALLAPWCRRSYGVTRVVRA